MLHALDIEIIKNLIVIFLKHLWAPKLDKNTSIFLFYPIQNITFHLKML